MTNKLLNKLYDTLKKYILDLSRENKINTQLTIKLLKLLSCFDKFEEQSEENNKMKIIELTKVEFEKDITGKSLDLKLKPQDGESSMRPQ